MKLLSPAKINFFLQVTGRRPDGYHTLCSLMCAVGIFDTVTLAFGGAETRVTCNDPRVPSGADNIAWKAVALFFDTLAQQGKRRHMPVSVTIDKQIPVGAGLGGGSSNAATVLAGLNAKCGRPFSREALLDMGGRLGADVPFFLYGRNAWATGIGDRLSPAPPIAPLRLVIVYPQAAVSTAAVYKNLNLALTKCEKENRQNLFDGGGFDPVAGLRNDLESVAVSMCPAIRTAKETLLSCGADSAMMSGSGSSVFGVFFNGRAAASAADKVSARHRRWRVFLTEVLDSFRHCC